jgi:glutamine amidotransferase
MIAIIDYGAGNLRSVQNALAFLGADILIASKPDHLAKAKKIVLPGVGAFGAGMASLRSTGFEGPIKAAAMAGVPLLGICLGMQYLFESSDEMGQHSGLGLLTGRVTRFPANGLKVPHTGWNTLKIKNESPLLAGIPDETYAYFVHSYYVEASNPNEVLGETEYGIRFASMVGRDNIFGIQCHPEKSQKIGLRILKNFIELKGGA